MPKGRFPRGLIGMLALVSAIEAVERRFADELNDYVAQSWRFSREAAHRGGHDAEVLCFGDSLVKVGILPDLLAERTGISGYNLAVFGGQAPSSYFLLRRALDSGARPRAIVVDFHGNLLAASPRSSVPYWCDLASPGELGELFLETGDVLAGCQTLFAAILPTIVDRREIRLGIASAFTGLPWLSRRERRAEFRNWGVHRGGHVVPVASPGSFDPPPDPPGPVRWRPDGVNSAYLRRFLKLAADRRITVFWLMPPTSHAWTARRVRIGIEPRFSEFARSLVAEYPNLVVVDGRDSGFPDVLFRDSTHMNRVGAAGLTAALARVLSERRDSDPRWVQLPPFVEPPGHWGLEDVDQSAIALEAPGAIRR